MLFAIVIHLLSEQRVPIFFGICQFKAKKHFLITTNRFNKAAKSLVKLAKKPIDVIILLRQRIVGIFSTLANMDIPQFRMQEQTLDFLRIVLQTPH